MQVPVEMGDMQVVEEAQIMQTEVLEEGLTNNVVI